MKSLLSSFFVGLCTITIFLLLVFGFFWGVAETFKEENLCGILAALPAIILVCVGFGEYIKKYGGS